MNLYKDYFPATNGTRLHTAQDDTVFLMPSLG